jgi:hypothetical protein
MSKEWFSPRDAAAKATFDAFQEAIGPVVADLLPTFRLTHIGFNRMPDDMRFSTGRDEIQVTLHLRPLGEAYAIQTSLEAKAMPDLLGNYGDKA